MSLGKRNTYPPSIHVVDIDPFRLEGDACDAVVGHYLGQLEDVAVSVPAVMKPKAPVRHHGWEPGDLGVLSRYLDRARPSNKVQVKHATEGVVLQVLAGLPLLVDLDIHAIGVEEEDAVSAALAVLEVHRVVAVQVGVLGDTVCILAPQGSDVAGRIETKRVRVFS